MAKILVTHSRKGGVGKSTSAYEVAYILDAVLVDLEHDIAGVTSIWGDRPLDRVSVPILDALESGRTPKPLKGYRKPRLVPGHPHLDREAPSREQMSEALLKWAAEWDTEWVVVDTHPGAAEHTHGALAVADVVLAPTTLDLLDLRGLEQLVDEMLDYPIVVLLTKVRPIPSGIGLRRLDQIVENNEVQVAPPIPLVSDLPKRTKRIAITSEDPPAKPLRLLAERYKMVGEYVKEYAAR